MYPDIKGFTWCNARDVPTSRIDYVFISNNFVPRIENILLRKIPGTHSGKRMSDHRFVKFTLKILNNNRGPGYWKLNVSYCENEEYKSNIRNIVRTLDNSLGAIDRWELLKRIVKDFSIYFAKNINYAELKSLEARLNLLYDEKIKGTQIRSKARWIENGEKNSNFFLNLEKHRQTLNVIRELKSHYGETVNKTNSILGDMVNFYTSLYSSKNIPNENIIEYLSNIDVLEINADDRKMLNKFPSYEECKDAVFQMKKDKSPGFDGISSEFYQMFWSDIGPLFYAALEEIYDQEELTSTQKLSIVSLLFKKDERNLLKNYRPISLTNTDYKIIAFVFAKRLQNVL